MGWGRLDVVSKLKDMERERARSKILDSINLEARQFQIPSKHAHRKRTVACRSRYFYFLGAAKNDTLVIGPGDGQKDNRLEGSERRDRRAEADRGEWSDTEFCSFHY